MRALAHLPRGAAASASLVVAVTSLLAIAIAVSLQHADELGQATAAAGGTPIGIGANPDQPSSGIQPSDAADTLMVPGVPSLLLEAADTASVAAAARDGYQQEYNFQKAILLSLATDHEASNCSQQPAARGGVAGYWRKLDSRKNSRTCAG